ncbi:hypothetical protein CLV75_2494 [Ruegeria conchae]|uniref:Uncharacterized protein n=1 Tax=Ruegeria conchae TaxID=981384 RepID=A0A497ZK44_9RHOB|nr:hypothetical protein CLV75_2494 [Ruegeria conchae]
MQAPNLQPFQSMSLTADASEATFANELRHITTLCVGASWSVLDAKTLEMLKQTFTLHILGLCYAEVRGNSETMTGIRD